MNTLINSHVATLAIAVLLHPNAASAAVAQEAELFDVRQVRLLDGIFKDAQETDKAYLLRLDPDRFLHTFRTNVGLPSTAKPYGGWEAPNCELRGHSLGHYLTACSMMYAATGEAEFKKRADYIVAELAKCQAAAPDKGFNKGYLSAYPEEFIDRVEAGKQVWAPYYTLHKIFAGLLDAHRYCDNATALDVVRQFADWVGIRLSKLDQAGIQKMLGNEHGGMAESLAEVYARTGDAKYLALAKAFRHDRVYTPMLENRDTLTGLHGNTQIPKFTGYQRIYELTGETDWARASRNFWTFVTRDRSYVIGGNTTHEMFHPIEKFPDQMHTVVGPETCNSYNMLKLSAHLFCEKPAADVADFYERALYNHVLTAQRPGKGGYVYYTSLRPGTFRGYSRDESDFWCCVGTGMENYARAGEFIYARAADTLYVNLFIPSELTWKEKGLVVRQETKFPDEQTARLTFRCAKPVKLAVKLRCPAWAEGMTVSGTNVKPQPGSYVTIEREWKDGDTLTVRLPMKLREELLPQTQKFVAFLYGPVVLAGRLGREGLNDDHFHALAIHELAAPALEKTASWVTENPAALLSNITPVKGRPLTFRARGLTGPAEVELIPLFRLHEERYNVYWRCVTPAERESELQRLAEQERRERELAARIVDKVEIGIEPLERAHRMRGERTDSGEAMHRRWRHATGGGWFSYELNLTEAGTVVLVCTYWGGDEGNREFDILVDDQKIATQKLANNKPGQFFDVEYALPAELTAGKRKITVKFQAHEGNFAGGVFGCALLKQ